MSLTHQQLVEELYKIYLKSVSELEKSAENFMDFLVKAMEETERYANAIKSKIVIHGIDKKEFVIDILQKFMEDSKEWCELREEDFNCFVVEMQTFMNRTIDVLISASKGQFKLGFNDTTVCCKPCSRNTQRILVPKDISEVGSLTDQIYKEVKQSIVNKKFGPDNIIVLITLVMQVVEKMPNLTGDEKKEFATRVIKRLLLEIPMTNSERTLVELIINTTLSKTIDYIILAANGNLNFGEIANKCKTVFWCCKKN